MQGQGKLPVLMWIYNEIYI